MLGAQEEQKDPEAARRGGRPSAAKPEFEEHEDPINYLGFGLVSYFDLIKLSIFIFFVLTLCHIPVMRIYNSYNSY